MGAADPPTSRAQARVVRSSAGPDLDRPWGADSKPPPHGGGRGKKRARGIAATPVAVADRDDGLRRGTPRGSGQDVGRRQDQGARASSDTASRVSLLLFLRALGADTCGKRSRSGAPRQRGNAAARRLKAASDRRKNPMDGSGPRGREAMRGAAKTVEEVRNLRTDRAGGGNPRITRTRNAHVVEGAKNPRRGRSRSRDLGPEPRNEALRGAQACGSCLGRRPGTNRSTEDLVAASCGAEGAANQ
jgi:hypothetical protein